MFLARSKRAGNGTGTGSREPGFWVLHSLHSRVWILDAGFLTDAGFLILGFWTRTRDAGLGSRDWTLLRSPRDDSIFFLVVRWNMEHGHATTRHAAARPPSQPGMK